MPFIYHSHSQVDERGNLAFSILSHSCPKLVDSLQSLNHILSYMTLKFKAL